MKGSWRAHLRACGPGLLFAGAAIGVSHLVQSTRAGAGWGFGLLWAVLLALVAKYPFILYGHRYTVATGESLLQGYLRLGRGALLLFMILVVGSAFITMAAVTVVTAGLAGVLLGLDWSLTALSAAVLAVVLAVCAVGRYRLLDGIMKVMVLVLAVLTLVAVTVAVIHGPAGDAAFVAPPVWSAVGITFLLALMGWMPTPLDVAVWPSLWILEKSRHDRHPPTMDEAMVDFHVGYLVTAVLAVGFVAFGALVMFGTGQEFSASGLVFARQLVDMYTAALGDWSRWIISLVAFITMFSTTLTVLDGYARTLGAGVGLLTGCPPGQRRRLAATAQPLVAGLALAIIALLMRSMTSLVDVVTLLAFLAAPVIAWLNFKVMKGPQVPPEHRPGRVLTAMSWSGLVFLAGFSLVWIWVRWLR
ncbi:divalent metal cation transporter [bacterium]|nr:MAG: divalent metal cation transporter [bacterium]